MMRFEGKSPSSMGWTYRAPAAAEPQCISRGVGAELRNGIGWIMGASGHRQNVAECCFGSGEEWRVSTPEVEDLERWVT